MVVIRQAPAARHERPLSRQVLYAVVTGRVSPVAAPLPVTSNTVSAL